MGKKKGGGGGEISPGCQTRFISLETLTSEVARQAQSGQMLPGQNGGRAAKTDRRVERHSNTHRFQKSQRAKLCKLSLSYFTALIASNRLF